MKESSINALANPENSADPLSEILRNGTPRLIEQAVEAEDATLLEKHAKEKDKNGHARHVRYGHLPERKVMTGIGAVAVKVQNTPAVHEKIITT